jgi:adenylate kinase
MCIVLIGPPGSGKGTQAERLTRRLSVPHLSTGEMLRAAVASGSELGAIAAPIMARGELVSDELIIGVVRQRIRQADCQRGFLLDGFPRTVAQAEALDALLQEQNLRLLAVLALSVPDDELIRRLQSRYHALPNPRPDDRPEAIPQRITTFLRETQPVLDYYASRGVLTLIDGIGSVDEVFQRMLEAVDGSC